MKTQANADPSGTMLHREERRDSDCDTEPLAYGFQEGVSDAVLPGQALPDGYEFIATVGAGGMGKVFKVRHKRLGRIVAIKMLLPQYSFDVRFAQRFHKEAQALAAIQHPNVVAIHDFGEFSNGSLYLVMEFVDGMTLRDKIKKGPVAFSQALQIMEEVCAGLAEGHALGIVHRDVKPENILLDAQGRVKVADFGLAVSTKQVPQLTSGVAGTLVYMAPEQKLAAEPVSPATDVYALGLILYELLVGTVPQGAFEPASNFAGTPPILDNIVRRCLQADPKARYATAKQLSYALSGLREQRSAVSRRNILRYTVGATVLGGVGLGICVNRLMGKINLLESTIAKVSVKGTIVTLPEGVAKIKFSDGAEINFDFGDVPSQRVSGITIKCQSNVEISQFEFSLTDGTRTWRYQHPKNVPAGDWHTNVPGSAFSPPIPRNEPLVLSSGVLKLGSKAGSEKGLASEMLVTEFAITER